MVLPGRTGFTVTCGLLFGDAQKHRQAALDLEHRGGTGHAKDRAKSFAFELVQHPFCNFPGH